MFISISACQSNADRSLTPSTMHERMRFNGLEAKCFFLFLIIIFPLFFNESKKRDAAMGTLLAYD
jgi:hypothetical protein